MDYITEMARLCCLGSRDCLIGLIKPWDFRKFHLRHMVERNVSLSALAGHLLIIIGLNYLAYGMLIGIFDSYFLPVVEQFTQLFSGYFMRKWLCACLQIAFYAFWCVPMYLVSRIVNCVVYQEVADVSYKMAVGPINCKSGMIAKWSDFISDFTSAMMLQALFFVQCVVVSYFPIPWVADVLSFVHMCLLYSLYAFDYKWVNSGWPLNYRIAVLDSNFPYFVGYGMPLAVLTTIADSFVNKIVVFSVFFPLLVISAMNTTPVVGNVKFKLRAFDPVILLTTFFTKYGINYLQKPRSK